MKISNAILIVLAISLVLIGTDPGYAEIRRLYLYDDIANYPWSGFMGSSNGSSITLNLYDDEDAYEGMYRAQITTTGQEPWCGIAIQSRPDQWNPPGSDFSDTLALKLRIKGQGSESIIIKSMNDKYSRNVTLTNQWQQVVLPFNTGDNFTSITSLASIVIPNNQNITIYLDEIYFEIERPQLSPTHDLPSIIKGVGYNEIDPAKYDSDFAMIKNSLHANTLRFWGQTDFTHITLDKAAQNNLNVIISYWIPYNADFHDLTMKNALKHSIKNFLKFYLPHNSVIMLSIGNEVFHNLFPNTGQNKIAFATFLDELAVEIHTIYPNLMITYAAVGTEPIVLLKNYSPNLNFYGCNSYGNIGDVIQEYESSGYSKPFIFLEFGCFGWWEKDWLSYSDEQRAFDYVTHWSLLRASSMGGCAFAWIDKSENGYIGWGLMNNDRTPRSQFKSLAGSYAELKDVIAVLKIVAGIDDSSAFFNTILDDVNGDAKIGVEEAIFLLQRCADIY